jgi:hypothetical protein
MSKSNGFSEAQEAALEEFIKDFPVVLTDEVPPSLIRLCFFSGMKAGIEQCQKVFNGQEIIAQD